MCGYSSTRVAKVVNEDDNRTQTHHDDDVDDVQIFCQ
jgi:hypothetical protein